MGDLTRALDSHKVCLGPDWAATDHTGHSCDPQLDERSKALDGRVGFDKLGAETWQHGSLTSIIPPWRFGPMESMLDIADGPTRLASGGKRKRIDAEAEGVARLR